MKYKNLFLLLLGTASLSGCIHANVSNVPQMINGEAIFTYQGRSNFGFQLEAADKFMIKHCLDFNGGSPVALKRSTQDLGYVVSNDFASGNQNQVVLFKCIDK